MTGSSNKLGHALSPQIGHALSPQWNELVAAAERQSVLMRAQPEAWWGLQATSFSEKWLASGLPTTRLENWKYTSLASLHSKGRTPALGPVDVTVPPGVRVLRLSQLSSQSEISTDIKSTVRKLLEVDEDIFFENFAKSFVADPFIILVDDETRSDMPIEITWRGLPEGQWAFGVAAVIVGTNAQVSLIERYGADVDAQTVSVAIELGAGAKLSHLRIQSGSSKSELGFVFSNTRAHVLKNAVYENAQVSFGSSIAREDLTVELTSPGAEAIVDGVFIGRSNQVLDHHTNLVHRVGQTTSRQIYKGVLADESRGVFNGRIAISKNASGSNSSQMNKNLLLSRKVELDTKPQLEIDNDDVKAAHGAAIGRLDAEHIFYLRSRGIGMSEAVEMLARGFATEAVQRLSSVSLRALGTSEIERGLAGLSWESL